MPSPPARPRGMPSYWRSLPELAAAAQDPAAGAARSSYRAWGDPASGVFLVIGQVEFPGRAGDSAQRTLHQSMESALTNLGIEVNGISTSLDQDPLLTRFALRRGDLVGQARLLSREPTMTANRATADGHRAILVVCFHNQREPVLGARVCDHIVREQHHDQLVQLMRDHHAMQPVEAPREEPMEDIDP